MWADFNFGFNMPRSLLFFVFLPGFYYFCLFVFELGVNGSLKAEPEYFVVNEFLFSLKMALNYSAVIMKVV